MKIKYIIFLFLIFISVFANPTLHILKDTVIFSIQDKRFKKPKGYSQPIECEKEITYINGNGIIEINNSNSKLYILNTKNEKYTPHSELCEKLPTKIATIIRNFGNSLKGVFLLTNETMVNANGNRGNSNNTFEYNISIPSSKKDNNKTYIMYGLASIVGKKPIIYLYKNNQIIAKIEAQSIIDNNIYYMFKIPKEKFYQANRYEIKSFKNKIKVKGSIYEQHR